jgi:uncharacterized OsmC-like protein
MAKITAELTTGTQVTISNGRHTWRADEPPDAGGNDTGPTPYDLLVGSLAACTLVTLALYCRHKQIPLKAVTATYEHGRIHAKDCEDCEEETSTRRSGRDWPRSWSGARSTRRWPTASRWSIRRSSCSARGTST